MKEKNVAIIGAGLIGLTAAYYLNKKGIKTTIIEKSEAIGGLAGLLKIENTYLEKYYHHFFKSDEHLIKLLKDLNIEGDLKWIPAKMGLYYKGKLYPFSTPFDLLRFKPIPFFSRIRSGVVSLYLQKLAKEKHFKGMTANTWCEKYFGKHAYKVIWEPLLISKFGNTEYKKVAMVWIWRRLKDRGSSRTNLLKDENLGYLDGSLKNLFEKIVNEIRKNNSKIHTSCEILDFENVNAKNTITWRDKSGEKHKETFTHVISTIPPNEFIEIFDLPAEYQNKWNKIEYIGTICVVLELKKCLQKYYWTSVNDIHEPFVAVIEHTNLVDKKLFNNKHIVYLGKYLKPTEKLFNMNNIELRNTIVKFLKKINKNFKEEDILNMYVFKDKYSQHIVNTTYKVPPIESGIHNVYLVNFAQIYPQDRGVNNAIKQGYNIYKTIIKQ